MLVPFLLYRMNEKCTHTRSKGIHKMPRRSVYRTMKDKIFGVLQRVGRSFMLPIAILPVAGLLLGTWWIVYE